MSEALRSRIVCTIIVDPLGLEPDEVRNILMNATLEVKGPDGTIIIDRFESVGDPSEFETEY